MTWKTWRDVFNSSSDDFVAAASWFSIDLFSLTKQTVAPKLVFWEDVSLKDE